MSLDINSDLGEGFGIYTIAPDDALLDLVTSVNVACGYHAGDPMIMTRTVREAHRRGLSIGAHFSYPDRAGFGRRVMEMPSDELRAHIIYQLGALAGVARSVGAGLDHVNPHGALGNLASSNADIARLVVDAVSAFDPELAYFVLPGSALDREALARGFRTVRLFLADRAYDAGGQLVPRATPGSVIKDLARVRQRIQRLLSEGVVEAIDGTALPMKADSILVHSDTPTAVEIAEAARQAIEGLGQNVRAWNG